MDLPPEELQFLRTRDVLNESVAIPKRSPETFYRITLTLVFPLSFAILAHSLFTHPIFLKISDPHRQADASSQWTKLFVFQFFYLIFLFAFSLLSTAAVVFTVASLYTGKPVSFATTIHAIPSVFKRLFITYLWVSLTMVFYNSFFLLLLILAVETTVLVIVQVSVISLLYVIVHVYITAIWHLASVVSVLEPVYGLAAMKKSYELLQGRVKMAAALVSGYLAICLMISLVFGAVVVNGDKDVFTKILIGGSLIGVLVIVNLVGLMVQSLFYYVCKSHHHQEIDKTVLYDHLGGYLGVYVPLKSNIQLEDLDI